ncbi:MAG: hypothetical protein E7461_00645 [Ruminococcaceae bacterium]|nr:hypothetical protein [Oscillospiraceae bacterium]
MKKHLVKQGGQTGKPFISVAIGVFVSLLLTFLLTAGAALLVSEGKVSEEAIGTAVWVIQFLSVATGCIIATVHIGRIPAVIATVCAAAYLLLMIGGNILFLDNSLNGIGSGVFASLCGAFSAIILQLLGKKGGKRRNRR